VIQDLGFTEIALNPDLSLPVRAQLNAPDSIIEFAPLEKFRLLEVGTVAGIIQVRLNSNHPFIKSIVENGKLSPTIELYIKSYANCMLRMAGSIDALETFNSYLGLELYNVNPSDASPQ
jgi:hypothetical protein